MIFTKSDDCTCKKVGKVLYWIRFRYREYRFRIKEVIKNGTDYQGNDDRRDFKGES